MDKRNGGVSMETKRVCVNVYNFIRMSNLEPSQFIQDDFDTIRNQIIVAKQYGFPGTYALKYDAVMEPRYQELLKQYLDDGDELSAWWEITSELCRRSGVAFRDSRLEEEYDDRVNSAYSIGYSPEERKKLVDGYMADFHAVFGKYPKTIGSWVLDTVTLAYAAEKYGIVAGATCRDQIGVDGFTLWGGYPNGAYYPSKRNENVPAQNPENQLPIPVFRLLGPDPIYNFEAEVRKDLPGVYTLEPAWLVGRDPKWIRWLFDSLTGEDTIGMGYAHVGQENNFLWENIRPGYAPQLEVLKQLSSQGKLRVETMAQSASWFLRKYRITPPMTYQASRDWSWRNLSCQWYASANYRIGLLGEEGHLRIRDLFVYDEAYISRYLNSPMKNTKSTFDALPVLYPQLWIRELGSRPYIRLTDDAGEELTGTVSYRSIDDLTVEAALKTAEGSAVLTCRPGGIRLQGCSLIMDALPVFTRLEGNELWMEYEGFSYCVRVSRGRILRAEKDGVRIDPEGGEILLVFGPEQGRGDIYVPAYLEDPDLLDSEKPPVPAPSLEIPAIAPEFIPGDSVFTWGSTESVTISAQEPGEIRYTLDGTEPDKDSPLYSAPIAISRDCTLCARLFTPDGRASEVSQGVYRFGLKDLQLESPTELDRREVFFGNGIGDLLAPPRGSLDYLDGVWRGTLQNVDVTCTLDRPRTIASVSMGFLSHHRSGIVYPEEAALYAGPDKDHLELVERMVLPLGPGVREIEKQDITFSLGREIGAFRYVAKRYARMPQWCAYRGTPTVFTMTDNLIVVPEE